MDGRISQKSESRGDKICSSLVNLHHQIDQLTLILYGVGVRCDRQIPVHSPFIEKSMHAICNCRCQK